MSSYSQISTDVTGVGTIIAVPEYTSQALADEYRMYLNAIITIFNLSANSTTGEMPTVSTAQAQAMVASVNALLALAKDGKTDATTGVKSYLTIPMANDLDVLVQSLKAVGIPVINGAIPAATDSYVTQLQIWKDMAQQSPLIQELMESIVVSGDTGANSLQALVELVYVRQGNQIIGDGLDALQTALATTKDSLDILAQLQNVHNKIEITAKSTFMAAYKVPAEDKSKSDNRDLYGKGVKSAISAFFNPPIIPGTAFISVIAVSVFVPGAFGMSGRYSTKYVTSAGAALIEAQKQLVQLKNSLSAQLVLLKSQTSTAVLNDPVKLAASPYGQLQSVYNDLAKTLVYSTTAGVRVPITSTTPPDKAYAGVQAWMLDNYDKYASTDSSSAGLFQQRIVNASTALSSLNTTQTEKVRNYLFVFEEFYKSASAVLQSMTQIIQKMASNINK